MLTERALLRRAGTHSPWAQVARIGIRAMPSGFEEFKPNGLVRAIGLFVYGFFWRGGSVPIKRDAYRYNLRSRLKIHRS